MTTAVKDTGVGPLLRTWRKRRGLSQLELALLAESSARHISFLETGRSRPSHAMVLRLAEQLDVPVRERNGLLLAAGYAPAYSATPLDDPAMGPLREAIARLLRGFEPFPAIVVDAAYTVLDANRGAGLLLEGVDPSLTDPAAVPAPNAMRITLHPQGMAPRIRNFPVWRTHLLDQMRRQLALVRSEPLRALYEEVSAYPPPERSGPAGPLEPGGAGDAAEPAATPHPHPYLGLPLLLEYRGRTLSFLSSIATFNTPLDVTVAELAIETFLPADDETAAFLRGIGADLRGTGSAEQG